MSIQDSPRWPVGRNHGSCTKRLHKVLTMLAVRVHGVVVQTNNFTGSDSQSTLKGEVVIVEPSRRSKTYTDRET